MKKFVVFVLFFVTFYLGSFVSTAQIKSLNINTIDSLMYKKNKPILVLLTTEWCKYCMIQKSQIKKDKILKKKSEQFYFTIFDAESNEDILFKKHLFKKETENPFNKRAIHPLATALNQSKNISFPTWIILNNKYEIIYKHKGLLSNDNLLNIIDKL